MRESWRPKSGDWVVRHPHEEQMGPVRLTVTSQRVQSRALGSPLALIYAFAGLISIGAGESIFKV